MSASTVSGSSIPAGSCTRWRRSFVERGGALATIDVTDVRTSGHGVAVQPVLVPR